MPNAGTDPVGDLGFEIAVPSLAATILAVAALHSSWGWGVMDDLELLQRMGGITRGTVTEPWRLLSHAWVHADPEHLVGNLLALVALGWPLERAIGWRRVFLLYTVAVFGSGLITLIVQHPLVGIGASGGVFALLGAIGALAVRPRGMLHSGEVQVLREAVFPIGLAAVLSSFVPGVAWSAHLAGLAIGVLAGGSGLLVLGLDRRAEYDGGDVSLHVGRTVLTTLGVGVLACGCGPLMFGLQLAYLVVVILIARVEPRYSARDGVGVTLAATGAALLLWGSLAVAWVRDQPWDWQSTPQIGLEPVQPEAPAAVPGSAIPVSDAIRRPPTAAP